MASSRASMVDCATSVSTSTCSPISTRRARSSKNGGSTTTPTDRTRASTGSHRLSSQHAPHRGTTGTDSPYKRGQFGEQVKNLAFVQPIAVAVDNDRRICVLLNMQDPNTLVTKLNCSF